MEFTKEDLKLGDICVLDNKSVWQVIDNGFGKVFNCLITCQGNPLQVHNQFLYVQTKLDSYNDELTHSNTWISDVKVVKVYRPIEHVSSLISISELAIKSKFTLIFDRERDKNKEKELDIAQVCKEIYEWYDSENNHKYMNDILDMITRFPRKKWLEDVYNPKAAAYIIIKYNEDLDKQNEKEKVVEEVKNLLIDRNRSKLSEYANVIVNHFYDYDIVQELDSVSKKAEKILAMYDKEKEYNKCILYM